MCVRTIVFCILLFALNWLKAQENGTLFGLVTSGKDTLSGAVIRVGKEHVTTSNAGGHFTLNIPAGTYKLECSMTGYERFTLSIKIAPGEIKELNITLPESTNPLNEIVVSAERHEQKLGEVTVSTDILKPALLQNKNITTLDQAINQVPGVVVADGQASIRGGSGFSYGAGSRVLMLVDEMPMISADAADIKWNYLPIENIEQVEVVKGAGSVLYGSGALNGVINLRTAFARSEPRTQATLFYGGYERPLNNYKWWQKSTQRQRGVSFSHAQKLGQFDLVFGGNMFSDDGYRMLETENRERFNTNLRYLFKKAKGLEAGVNTNMMGVRGGLFFLWYAYDSAYIPSGMDIQRYNNKRFNVDPWVSYTLRSDSGENFSISFRNRYFKTENSNDKGQGSYSELYYSELRVSKQFGRLNCTGGIVHMEQMVLGDSLYGVHKGRNNAAYLQFSYRIRKLLISAGVRAEQYKLDSVVTKGNLTNNTKDSSLPFQPVVRVGLNYQLAKATYLRASFGQGYRFPSVAEKYISTAVGTLKVFPNLNLQPERAYSAELSIRQGFRILGFKAFVDLAGFYTRYHNMIEFVFDIYKPGGATGNLFGDLNYAGFKSQNIGEAEIRGAELSFTGTGRLGPINLQVLAGYTYIDPLMVNFDPKRDTLGLQGVNTLKYRSRNLFKADVQADYKIFSIGYSARFQSRTENIDRRFITSVFSEYSTPTFNFNNVRSTFILPGLKENYDAFSKAYLVQDARFSVQVTPMVKISFIVNNFMNVEYQARPGDMRPPTMYIGQVLVKI